MSDEWVPEFVGQRPPFTPGHQLSVKSGAWSPSHIDARADQILKELAEGGETVAYLNQPAYAATVRMWARVQGRAELYGEWLFEKSEEEQLTPPNGGTTRSPLDTYLSFVRTALALSDRLGLTPLSRARLGRDVATAEAIAGAQLRGWIDHGPAMAKRDADA